MRIACVLITHLRARVELRRQPHLRARPAVIADRSAGRPRVVDAFPAATGMLAGMTLDEALSRYPDAIVLEADEPAYRRVFRQTLTALQGVSDRVEGAELGTVYVGLDGLESLHGGEAALVRALREALPRDLEPRIGVAEAKFPAFVAARTGRGPEAVTVPADPAPFLAPHPINLLPISRDALGGLLRFGLHTMGAVAAMRPELLIDQFGNEGRRAWELSQGIDDRPLLPIESEEAVVERIPLPFASASLELALTGVDTLLRRAFARPAARGRRAGRAELTCLLHEAPPWERAFHFRHGVGSREEASPVIRRRLEHDHPEAPVEELVLELGDLGEGVGEQLGLFPDVRAGRERRLEEAERQLRARLGGPALYRMTSVAPWHPAPEMRVLQAPIDPAARDAMRPLAPPAPVTVEEGPEGQPLAVRLERGWRPVARIEDHWSFDLWWLPAPLSRDYYRVRGEDGRRVTLFRDRREARWYRQAC